MDWSAKLDAMVAAGREAWPDVELAPDVFAAHLEKRLAGVADREATLDKLRAADLYLACACAHGEPNALRAFESHHLQIAVRAVSRFGDPNGFAADAIQELRERLLVGTPPRIAEYAATGSLEAWVKVAAVRVAINLREKENVRAGEPDRAEESLAAVRDPELDLIKARYRGDFTAALRAAFAELDVDDRAIMRFYLIDHLNIAQIGALYGKSRATIGRRVVAIREQVLENTRKQLKTRLSLATEEIDSLIALLRSQVDLSLSQILGAPA
jgi:RNA polymerase sigma-70 factor, ECF subfamily